MAGGQAVPHAGHDYRAGPMDDKHHPGRVRRTAVSKRGLKGSLVVVVEVIVVTTTKVTPWNFDTRSRVRLRLCAALGVFAFLWLKFA